MTSENKNCCKSSTRKSYIFIYIQSYFVTIATILGTGILGLPVTLAYSGIYPFLLSFVIGFLVQVLLIYFVVDILQRAHAKQIRTYKESEVSAEHVPLYDIDEEDETWNEIEDDSGPVMAGHIILPQEAPVQSPNLHLLGQLFLPCGLRQMFDALIIIQFMAFLMSYSLAGPEAYGQVLGIEYFYIIPVFVWVFAFFIVFALACIQPVVSVLTFIKGSLIVATVAATFVVGATVHNDISNDFTYIGAPLLMGTVALGGVMNVLPFLYGQIEAQPARVRGFRRAVTSGLATCAFLNILWCWAVLDIVPQSSMCVHYQVLHNNSLHSVDSLSPSRRHEHVCGMNISLANSEENGEISTIPLTKIIETLYPAYDWVAILVQLFIMISITVSFLTLGAAMHHTVIGCVTSVVESSEEKPSKYARSGDKPSLRERCCNMTRIISTLLSLAAFSIVFTVAMLNPKGFVQMLEKVASLFLNLEAGLFCFLMALRSRQGENRTLSIPLPLARWQYSLLFMIPIYFGFAVFYDVLVSIHQLLYHDSRLPWEHVQPTYNMTEINSASVDQFTSGITHSVWTTTLQSTQVTSS